MENYIKGHAVISADTNNDGGKKFCVIPYDKIESLIENTPNEYRNSNWQLMNTMQNFKLNCITIMI